MRPFDYSCEWSGRNISFVKAQTINETPGVQNMNVIGVAVNHSGIRNCAAMCIIRDINMYPLYTHEKQCAHRQINWPMANDQEHALILTHMQCRSIGLAENETGSWKRCICCFYCEFDVEKKNQWKENQWLGYLYANRSAGEVELKHEEGHRVLFHISWSLHVAYTYCAVCCSARGHFEQNKKINMKMNEI